MTGCRPQLRIKEVNNHENSQTIANDAVVMLGF